MLNIYELVTVNMLASYMGKKNKCWPKQKELARVCRVSERQLRRTLNSLEDKKIINIKRTKSKNIYSFNEFWLEESDRFLSKGHAADAFLNRPISPANRPISPVLLSINNINNNRADLKDMTSYKPAPSAALGSPLYEQFNQDKNKH